MQDHFVISAKPFLISINRNVVYVNQYTDLIDKLEFLVKSPFLKDIRNVYLSASDTSMFDNISYYDIFSNVNNLSANNPPFSAVKLQNFVYNEQFVAFYFPQIPKINGYVDVIVENEAGYGSLIKDSNSKISTAYDISAYTQNPSIFGIQIEYI